MLFSEASIREGRSHSFQPLDRASNSIRLVSLLRTGKGLISCRLYNYPIDNCPPFIALSYTWGPSFPARRIILDSENFEVRENLYTALRTIRDRRSWSGGGLIPYLDTASKDWTPDDREAYMLDPRYWQFFWIDALSID